MIYLRIIKPLLDYFGALTIAILLAPIFIVIGSLIALNDGLPIFYRGQRVGLRGDVFFIIKFRTMTVGSENGPGTTSRNDKRVTKLGAHLRLWKLDELPQLFNILNGTMSFVGPRPELKKFVDQYTDKEKVILSVKPGITDIASIEYRTLTSMVDDDVNPDLWYLKNVFEHKNKLRIQYAKEVSFCMDVRIFIRTLFSLFWSSK